MLEYLEMMVLTHKRARQVHNKKEADSWPYCCMEDFVLHFGEAFSFSELPSYIERGEMKQCFKNAYHLALSSPEHTYVEGFACGVIPVMHAWCIDSKDQVVDPTWTDGREYYGVRFNLNYVNEVIEDKSTYGVIDNWEDRFPLLSGAHTVEHFGFPGRSVPTGSV